MLPRRSGLATPDGGRPAAGVDVLLPLAERAAALPAKTAWISSGDRVSATSPGVSAPMSRLGRSVEPLELTRPGRARRPCSSIAEQPRVRAREPSSPTYRAGRGEERGSSSIVARVASTRTRRGAPVERRGAGRASPSTWAFQPSWSATARRGFRSSPRHEEGDGAAASAPDARDRTRVSASVSAARASARTASARCARRELVVCGQAGRRGAERQRAARAEEQRDEHRAAPRRRRGRPGARGSPGERLGRGAPASRRSASRGPTRRRCCLRRGLLTSSARPRPERRVGRALARGSCRSRTRPRCHRRAREEVGAGLAIGEPDRPRWRARPGSARIRSRTAAAISRVPRNAPPAGPFCFPARKVVGTAPAPAPDRRRAAGAVGAWQSGGRCILAGSPDPVRAAREIRPVPDAPVRAAPPRPSPACSSLPDRAAASRWTRASTRDLRWRLVGPFRGGRHRSPPPACRPAQRLLHRREQRRRLEDDRLRPHVDADLRRPADRLDRRDRRRAVGSERHLRRQRRRAASARTSPSATASTSPTDGGKTWTHLGLRDGQQIAADPRRPARRRTACSSPSSATRTARTRSAGVFRSTDGGETFAEGPLQGREHRRRSDLAFDPANPDVVYAVLWEARQGAVGERLRPGAAGQRPLQVHRRRHHVAADRRRASPSGRRPRPHRHRRSRRASPSRLYAVGRGANRRRASTGPDDGGEHWRLTNADPRVSERDGDFNEIERGPAERRRRLHRRTSVTWKSTDGGETLTALPRRARRRRLPPPLDQSRRPDGSSSTRATRAPSSP